MAVGMGSNKARLMRASNLALAVAALRFNPLVPRSEQLRELDEVVQIKSLLSPGIVTVASRAESPPPPPPPPPPPAQLPVCIIKKPPPPNHPPLPDDKQVPVPAFISAIADSNGNALVGHSCSGVVPISSPVLTSDVESIPVDDAKHWLVAWRRQQPRLEQLLLFAARRLPQCPAGDHALHEATFNSSDAMILQHLRVVLEGDMWKGESSGKDWVQAWLKWGEPFDIEDACECGRTIGGKSEQKRRDGWRWYFGSAPWLQPIMTPHLLPAMGSRNRSPSPQLPAPARPPVTPLVASANPPLLAGPVVPQVGVDIPDHVDGVWEFE